jgi:pyruvate/2-oxoglutarate dehydrogenase complex dihydrolipoamide dehydrogenase (E3) component
MSKIAIYQPRCSYYVGGGEIIPMQHAKYFTEIGMDVTLVTSQADFLKESDILRLSN